MVLSLMRKHAKSWIIKFLIAIIAIVFIFYFGYSFTSDRTVKVATVNGELITGMEYQRAYRELREALHRQYRDVWSESLVRMFDLEKQALENLIIERLISMEARKLGLEVTDAEIQQAIMAYPDFQIGGSFDMGRYRALLARHRMEPEDFEQTIARELLADKLRQLVLGFVPATEAEARDYYRFINDEIRVSYVKIDPEDYKRLVEASEAEIEAYFLDNRERYRIPEKIRAVYIPIDPEDLVPEVKLPERAVAHYYDYHRDSFVEPERVRAGHILIELHPYADEDKELEARQRAEEILKLAREGEDFAALAKKYSEDPAGPDGGDLGYFTRGQMLEPFEEAAFQLEKGEISDVVRTEAGFHVIKALDVQPARQKPLEEVRGEIELVLAEAAASELARERGLALLDQMPYEMDLAEYADQHGQEAREVPPFAQRDPVPGIGGTAELRQTLFSLKEGDISELMEVEGKFYIFQVLEKKSSRLPDLEEVFDDVKPDVVARLAALKAREEAEAFLEEVSKGGDWEALAESLGFETHETPFFSRLDRIEGIGGQTDMIDMVFALDEHRPFPSEAYEAPGGLVVFRWEEKAPFDEEAFEEEKELYRFRAMNMKQQAAFDGWLASLRNRAEVKVLRPLGRN